MTASQELLRELRWSQFFVMTKTKLIDGYPFVSFSKETYTADEMLKKSNEFYVWMDKRRTVRDFSDKHIPKNVIENIE